MAYQKKRSPAGPRRHIGADIALILRERHFWPLGAWMFLTGMGSFGFFSLWAGPYLMDAYGFSKTTTGNVLTMLPCAMVFGGPFLGYLSDKVLASRKRVLSWVSVTYAASWLVLFLYYDSLPFMALLVIFFLLGATGTGGAPIAYTATKELFSAEMAGTSIGAVNFFAFLGGVVAQPLIGFFLDRAGKVGAHYPSSAYQPVILSYFLVSLIILAVVFFVKETIRPERAERIK